MGFYLGMRPSLRFSHALPGKQQEKLKESPPEVVDVQAKVPPSQPSRPASSSRTFVMGIFNFVSILASIMVIHSFFRPLPKPAPASNPPDRTDLQLGRRARQERRLNLDDIAFSIEGLQSMARHPSSTAGLGDMDYITTIQATSKRLLVEAAIAMMHADDPSIASSDSLVDISLMPEPTIEQIRSSLPQLNQALSQPFKRHSDLGAYLVALTGLFPFRTDHFRNQLQAFFLAQRGPMPVMGKRIDLRP